MAAIESPFAPLYRQARADLLSVPVADHEVETITKQTHLLTPGDPEAPPLLLLQGANVTKLVTLSWFQLLAKRDHVLVPDTPGEPAVRATTTPADYGAWVASLLDGLRLEQAPAIGISHGGASFWGRPRSFRTVSLRQRSSFPPDLTSRPPRPSLASLGSRWHTGSTHTSDCWRLPCLYCSRLPSPICHRSSATPWRLRSERPT